MSRPGPHDVEQALERAEKAIAGGRPLTGTGFWKAVAEVRRRPDLASGYAGRIAAVDRRAFEAGVKLRVPAWLGNLLLGGATGAAIVAISLVPRFGGLVGTLVFLAAFGLLDVATHSLAHVAVGRLFGIRFTHYFVGGPPPPRPGAKVDYASYLRTPPRRRALMHASGAVVTKLVPFALVPAGMAAGVAAWAIAVLLVVGVGQIVTDVLFSVKTSDWKKVRRELRAARAWR